MDWPGNAPLQTAAPTLRNFTSRIAANERVQSGPDECGLLDDYDPSKRMPINVRSKMGLPI